jgi:cytoskeletal protein CcmA (bactofilin family)
MSLVMLLAMSAFMAPPAEASGSGGDIDNFSYGVLTDTLNMSSAVSGTFGIAATNGVSMSSAISHSGDILAGNGGVSLTSAVDENGNITAGSGGVSLNSAAHVNGNITAVGGVSLNSACTVNGNVTSGGPITLASASRINGATDAYDNSPVTLPPSSVPQPDFSWYESHAASTFTGNETFHNIVASFNNNSIYYVTGNLTCDSAGDLLANKATTIVVGGTITIDSAFNVSSTGTLALIAYDGIHVSSACNVENVLLWAGGNDGSNVSLDSAVKFTGDMVSPHGVSISSAVTINQEGTFPIIPPLKKPYTITLSPTSLPDGVVGSPYSQIITASGSTSLPYTFSVTSGSLPDWATLNSATSTTITLSGTPPATGTSTFTVTATDTNGTSGSQGYTLKVDPVTLHITTTSLPDGIQGVPYSTAVTASGGTTPYHWSATGLPEGLSIGGDTGVISGTPNTGDPLTSSVTITVKDSDGSSPQSKHTTLTLWVYPSFAT